MSDGGGLFGMAGQLGAAAMQAGAIKDAQRMQIKALEKQREFVFKELEPGKINAQAAEADILRAKQRLKLQGRIDPAALAARYAGEQKVLEGIQQLGAAESDKVAAMAAAEALKSSGQMEPIKQRLIDTAIQEIDAGATLPPDVQAELVNAGLERSGRVSGAATSRGFGGNILRKMIGERGIQLQAERQQRAAALATAAQNLETSRASVLGNLFPNLQRQQLGNIQAASGGVTMSEALKPDVGLAGTDIANIWMARVGAANQLMGQQANVNANAMSQLGQVWSNAIGGATRAGAPLMSSLFSSSPSGGQTPPPTPGAGGWSAPSNAYSLLG